jgi:hypothetical protein
MSLLDILAPLVVVGLLAGMVAVTWRAAAARKDKRDSADAGSVWHDIGGGD